MCRILEESGPGLTNKRSTIGVFTSLKPLFYINLKDNSRCDGDALTVFERVAAGLEFLDFMSRGAPGRRNQDFVISRPVVIRKATIAN